jgi:hypothetical protein
VATEEDSDDSQQCRKQQAPFEHSCHVFHLHYLLKETAAIRLVGEQRSFATYVITNGRLCNQGRP